MRGHAPAFTLVAALALCAPRTAGADPPHFQASVGTDAPISLMVRGEVELPGRLRLMASVGTTPQPYLDAFNGVLRAAAGGSTQSSVGILGIRLDSGSAWRLHAGWRPIAGAGLLIMGGYGRLNLAGSANAREVITSITGVPPSPQVPEANGIYDVRATLHMLDVELGREFLFFGDHLVIQTAVGLAGTVDARTTITPRFPSTTPGVAATRTQAQDYTDHVLRSYVFLPTFSLSLGYRFF